MRAVGVDRGVDRGGDGGAFAGGEEAGAGFEPERRGDRLGGDDAFAGGDAKFAQGEDVALVGGLDPVLDPDRGLVTGSEESSNLSAAAGGAVRRSSSLSASLRLRRSSRR